MRLIKSKKYNLVEKLLKYKNININNINDNGNTFLHLLALDSSVKGIKILDNVINRADIIPDIINNNAKTPLDIAIDNSYLMIAFKILFSNKFCNISINSFIRLLNISVNDRYGKYSKISNVEMVINNMLKKELNKELKMIVFKIRDNIDLVKKAIIEEKDDIDEIIGMA